MNKSYFLTLYLFPIYILIPLWSLNFSTWFSLWMFLELNTLTFIPLMIFFNSQTNKSFSSAIKYFIIQSLSSFIFLFSMFFIILPLSPSLNLIFTTLYSFSLCLKLGASPFHQWFINVSQMVEWKTCFLLFTWQKILPFLLLNFLNSMFFLFFPILLCSLMGAIFPLNFLSIRIILAFSSINHLSWLMLNSMLSKKIWMIYFLSYTITTLSIIFPLNFFNIYYLNQMNSIPLIPKFIILFNFFSLTGLPPFFGFFMKWISLNLYLSSNLLFISIFFLLTSTIMFFIYTRSMIPLMLNSYPKSKIHFHPMSISINPTIWIFFLTFFLNLWLISIYTN